MRTTFQTRKDQRVRTDEHESVYGTEMDPLHENGTEAVTSEGGTDNVNYNIDLFLS